MTSGSQNVFLCKQASLDPAAPEYLHYRYIKESLNGAVQSMRTLSQYKEDVPGLVPQHRHVLSMACFSFMRPSAGNSALRFA